MTTSEEYMSQKDKENLISYAIDATRSRRRAEKGSVSIFEYIENQLLYVQNCIVDKSTDRSRLHNVNIGMLAIREFEGVDDSYSLALKKAFFVVSYMKRGLKVPAIDELGNIR